MNPTKNGNIITEVEEINDFFWHSLDLLDAIAFQFDGQNNLIPLNLNPTNLGLVDHTPTNIYSLEEILGLGGIKDIINNANPGEEIIILRSEDKNYELRINLKSRVLTIQKLGAKVKHHLGYDDQANALLKAMNENRITLFRQPIVCANSGNVVRYECLARMLGEDGAFKPPSEFIPAAERAGLIANLDICALNLALKSIKNNNDLHLAVNVSAATIAEAGARQEFESLLKYSKNFAKNLTVEITETIAIQDLDVAAKFAAKVRINNARVALDDFGTGHTSFRSLKALPLDEVKIDGHFVERINERGDSRAFVKAIDSLSRDLGLETVAERVETQTEADILRDIGVVHLQGYLFGKPRAV